MSTASVVVLIVALCALALAISAMVIVQGEGQRVTDLAARLEALEKDLRG